MSRAGYHINSTRRLPTSACTPARCFTSVQTLLQAITVGSTLVMPHGKFDPAEALALIERHKISRWAAVPTMVSRLLDHPDVHREDLRSLRSVTVGGAPVHAELLQRIRTGLPSVQARIPTGYGLTENGGQATAASGADTAERPGSSGRPLPCVELTFLPRPGLPDGEILLRAPTQMSGYYGTDQSPIDQDGWLHTGDLGRLDDKGNLWITGRCKDMIIRGGENIAPVAVERALVAIPGIAEAVVFGVPHPDLGEEVMAIVVVEAELTPQHLQEQLRTRVASFAVPSRWQLQTEPLPLNHAGKVDKAALVARVCRISWTRTRRQQHEADGRKEKRTPAGRSKRVPQNHRTVDRVTRILEEVVYHPGMTFAELVRALNAAKSSVHGFMRGLLAKAGSTRSKGATISVPRCTVSPSPVVTSGRDW